MELRFALLRTLEDAEDDQQKDIQLTMVWHGFRHSGTVIVRSESAGHVLLMWFADKQTPKMASCNPIRLKSEAEPWKVFYFFDKEKKELQSN